jgi:hypothetical protein
MSNSPGSAMTWKSGRSRVVMLNSGDTARLLPPKVAGGELPGGRSALSALLPRDASPPQIHGLTGTPGRWDAPGPSGMPTSPRSRS